MLQRGFVLVFAILLLGIVSGGALAQTETSRPFKHITDGWNRSLDQVVQFLDSPVALNPGTAELRDSITRVRREAQAEKEKAEEQITALENLLTALGPAPDFGEPEESGELSDKRAEYSEALSLQQSRVTQSELAIARADQLAEAVSANAQERELRQKLHRYPLPFLPATMAQAYPEFFRFLKALLNSPAAWWEGLSEERQEEVIWQRVVIVLVLAVVLGWAVRWWLLRRFGRDPAIAEPSYTRRVAAAVSEAVARGIIPALIFFGIYWRTTSDTALITGVFADTVSNGCLAIILWILAWALSRAAFAPELPNWAIMPFEPQNARLISRRITILAGIVALDVFFRGAGSGMESAGPSPEIISHYVFIFATLQALGILDLLRASLWTGSAAPADTKVAEAAETETKTAPAKKPERGLFWVFVRRVGALLAVVTILAALAGYSALAYELIRDLLGSAIIMGGFFLVRGLLRELIGFAMRSIFLQYRMGFRHVARRRFKFWLRGILDAAILLIAGYLLLALWIEPFDDISAWTPDIMAGFTVGNVTFSLVDILAALLIFVVALFVTRMFQRLLSEKVLPETAFDSGVQHSIAAGFGYLGVIIAAALGISALGIDLSNIALIAGALSVGIGFGLQNVVNNFVSGLILLVERPVKVGDWVVVGQNEGFVKRINVRATELETFQRASVIIPNAELLSTSVMNWTLKDRYGRVEVPVGVAYGTDTRKVEEILLDCATDHARVLKWPEPFVVFKDFGASSLDFELRCFTSDVLWRVIIASDIRHELDQRFRDAGIEIPFPQRVVHFAGEAPPSAPAMAPRVATEGKPTEDDGE